MKLGFITCVQLGLSCMEEIYRSNGSLAFVATLPDDKAVGKSGRVYLDDFCSKHGIPLLKTNHVNDAVVRDTIREFGIDWLFIIGWSQIAGPELLSAPRGGVLGMHPTLLPVGRGRAAIPWAILKGLPETGVTLFKLDAGVDTGPIAAQMTLPLTPQSTASDLYRDVNDAHVALIREVVPKLIAGTLTLSEQDESRATIWEGRRPEDGAIDLYGSVWEAEKLIRAVTRPYPGAYYIRDGKKVIVWKARLASPGDGQGAETIDFMDGSLLIEEADWISIQ